MVSTLDSESSDPSSNLGGTYQMRNFFFLFLTLLYILTVIFPIPSRKPQIIRIKKSFRFLKNTVVLPCTIISLLAILAGLLTDPKIEFLGGKLQIGAYSQTRWIFIMHGVPLSQLIAFEGCLVYTYKLSAGLATKRGCFFCG